MFILQLKYKVPVAEVDKYLQAHRDYLDYFYKQGILLVSGPMKPRTGGIIVAATKDRDLIETIIKNDPYQLAEIADYEIIEFTPAKHCDELKKIITSMEGNLC